MAKEKEAVFYTFFQTQKRQTAAFGNFLLHFEAIPIRVKKKKNNKRKIEIQTKKKKQLSKLCHTLWQKLVNNLFNVNTVRFPIFKINLSKLETYYHELLVKKKKKTTTSK